ncbi:MAG: MoaD family protein [Clostridiales bacterium]|jgi:molybdopterin synthase sulfur carrier subunit|nr:MoaD family protein [Clostridiales bacterium]
MKVKFFATYRGLTGCSETDVPAPSDVWALLTYVADRYGEAMRAKLFTPDGKDIGADAIVLVNGRNIQYLKGKETALSETDVVSLFPMVAGG